MQKGMGEGGGGAGICKIGCGVSSGCQRMVDIDIYTPSPTGGTVRKFKKKLNFQ